MIRNIHNAVYKTQELLGYVRVISTNSTIIFTYFRVNALDCGVKWCRFGVKLCLYIKLHENVKK